jgi:WD repeat-containing protein 61
VQFLSGSVDGNLKLWTVGDKDVVSGPKWVIEGEFPLGVVSIVTISEELFAATSMDGCIRICSSADGKILRRINAGPVDCWSLCASDDGRFIASGTYTGAVNIWEVSTGALTETFNTNAGFGLSVAWRGQHVALGTKDGGVFQIDLETKDVHAAKTKIHHLPVRSLAYSRDGLRLVTASDDGTAAILTSDGGEKVGVFKGHLSLVLGVATGVSSIATACADKKVRLWDPETKECLNTFEAHTGQAFCVAFNKSGTYLASGGAGGDVQLFALAKA